MKKLVILSLAAVFCGLLRAEDRDTTLIKRPYYLGVTSGYSKFGTYAVDGASFDMVNLPRATQSYDVLYHDQSVGIELAFPFLRRWECETSAEFVQTFGWTQQCVYYEKNTQPLPEFVWHASAHDFIENNWRLRAFFSYELLRKGKFALNAGAAGWYSTLPRVGAETGLKGYYSANRNLTLQLGLSAGYTSITKLYGAVRFSVLLTGTRTYRARPDHYYVRTYED